MPSFEDITVSDLSAMEGAALDALPFGVVGMNQEGLITVYNATESAQAGLQAPRLMGKHFFGDIGQCMNNFMVAQRFEDEPELDDVIDYTLTLRMRPTPVKLRMLQSAGYANYFVLIKRINL